MKKYKLTIVLSAALLAVSCTDSFFNLGPSDKVDADKVYKTASDFNLAVIGSYSKLKTQFSFYSDASEYRGDNMYITAPTTGTQDRYDIDQFRETAANGILTSIWANFNNAVHRCNLILDQIDEANFDATLKKQYKGEALFIRAQNYFNMYNAWGGVPTTRKVVSVNEALQIGRSSEAEMYDFIAGDLKAIIDEDMLPNVYDENDLGRITSGAAKTLLGKVYLTFHKWTEARDVLQQVVGTYTLMNTPAEVFDVNNKMNNEIIFAIRYSKDVVGEGHNYWFRESNPANAVNPSPQLMASYTDPNDLRKDLMTYVQAERNVYVLKKFFDVRNPSTTNVGNDQILLRYADVLLMYAEALNEISYSSAPASPALNALNEVHTRAGLAPIDIASLPDKESFRKAILVERQQEFPYEGHRWFDLVRMGFAQEVMAEVGHNITENQLRYPIPRTVIERINNTDLVWQNPGY